MRSDMNILPRALEWFIDGAAEAIGTNTFWILLTTSLGAGSIGWLLVQFLGLLVPYDALVFLGFVLFGSVAGYLSITGKSDVGFSLGLALLVSGFTMLVIKLALDLVGMPDSSASKSMAIALGGEAAIFGTLLRNWKRNPNR